MAKVIENRSPKTNSENAIPSSPGRQKQIYDRKEREKMNMVGARDCQRSNTTAREKYQLRPHEGKSAALSFAFREHGALSGGILVDHIGQGAECCWRGSRSHLKVVSVTAEKLGSQ